MAQPSLYDLCHDPEGAGVDCSQDDTVSNRPLYKFRAEIPMERDHWTDENIDDPNVSAHTRYKAEGVSFANGFLTLTAYGEDTGDGYLLSGRVRSNLDIPEGVGGVVRFKIFKHQDSWPAIWLTNPFVAWPSGSGEFDILESQSFDPGFATTVHCGDFAPRSPCDYPPTNVAQCTGHVSPPLAKDDPATLTLCTAQPGVPNVFRNQVQGQKSLNVQEVGLPWFEEERNIFFYRDAEGFRAIPDAQVDESTGRLVRVSDGSAVCIHQADWYPQCSFPNKDTRMILNVARTPQGTTSNAIGAKMEVYSVRLYDYLGNEPSGTSTDTNGTSTDTETSKKLPGWAIALIVLGAVAVVALVLGLSLRYAPSGKAKVKQGVELKKL